MAFESSNSEMGDAGGDRKAPLLHQMRLPQLRLHYAGDHKHESDEGGSDSDDNQVAAAGAASVGRGSPPTPAKREDRKRPRYLSDIDRSVIIQRLERGDKQADLAREFGVTRAAICHINKNKNEVLTRFDTFARSAHGRVLIENYSRPSTEFESVTEVRTASATVLTTRIKDRATSNRNFRASADRLIKLLLEEALASYGSASLAVDSFSNQGVELLTLDSTPCAVGLEREGELMLDIFNEMEPEALSGSFKCAEPYSENASSTWHVMAVDLPDGIAAASVLLLAPVLSSAAFASAAVEELRARGVAPASICIVCISCVADAVRDLANRQPEVNIITASIEKRSVDSAGSLDDFLQRYFAAQG